MATFYDIYEDLLVEDPVEAARHAIGVARGKGSKSGAWEWARKAEAAASKVGIELSFGERSWPNLDQAESLLGT